MTLVQDPHAEVLRLLELERELTRRNKLDSYYPDAGPLRRDLYPKHMEFFRAGLDHRERALIAANRIGKSEGVGGYRIHIAFDGPISSLVEGTALQPSDQRMGRRRFGEDHAGISSSASCSVRSASSAPA